MDDRIDEFVESQPDGFLKEVSEREGFYCEWLQYYVYIRYSGGWFYLKIPPVMGEKYKSTLVKDAVVANLSYYRLNRDYFRSRDHTNFEKLKRHLRSLGISRFERI